MSESLNVQFSSPNQGQRAAAEQAREAQKAAGAQDPQMNLGTEADRILAELNKPSAAEATATPAAPEAKPAAGTTAHAATKPGEGVSHKRDSISDVVDLDAKGRAHYKKGVKIAKGKDGKYLEDEDAKVVGKLNGKFMSREELDTIERFADVIRAGEAERNVDGQDATYHSSKEFTEAVVNGNVQTGQGRRPQPGPGRPGNGGNQPPVIPPAPGSTSGSAPIPSGRDHNRLITDDHEIGIDFLREFPQDLAYDLATALNDWTNLAAARERATVTTGDISKESVEAARQRYEALRRQAKDWTTHKMEELGIEKPDRVMISKFEDRTEVKLAGLGIKFQAEKLADPHGFLAGTRRKFYDWWARQGGGDKFWSKKRLWGTTKKAAVMAAVGVPLGIAAGAAGAFIAGPLAGAAVAAGIARGVSRGFLRGRIDKNANAISVAGKQYEAWVNAGHQEIDDRYVTDDEGRTTIPYEVTGVFAENVDRNVRRNRMRAVGSTALGAFGGAVGSEIGHALWDAHGSYVWDHGNGGHHPSTGGGNGNGGPGSGGHHPVAPHAPKPEVPKPVKLELGHSGDSIWAETVDYAQQHGIHLSEGQKQHVVGEILKSNHQTWESARHLPIGYHFSVDPHELEEILGKKAA